MDPAHVFSCLSLLVCVLVDISSCLSGMSCIIILPRSHHVCVNILLDLVSLKSIESCYNFSTKNVS